MSALPDPLPASGRFDHGEHRFPVRVYFEDTDAGGIVYHASYLRFMERARSDMLRLSGIDQRAALADGTGLFAIADLSIRYGKPATLDDDLVVVSRMESVRAASCVIVQSIWRGKERLTDGRVTAAFVATSGKPRRHPAAWAATFNRLASGEDPLP